MKLVCYGRVSSNDQNLEVQIEAFKALGDVTIFCDKESGGKTDRKELAKAIASLSFGDTFVIHRIDRAARSTFDLLRIIKEIESKGAMFKSLTEGWCDTTSPTGRLMITILAGIAEWQKSMILIRCNEGRANARRKGLPLGRREKLTDYQKREVFERIERGESHTSIARSFNVHQTTVSALVKKNPQLALTAVV